MAKPPSPYDEDRDVVVTCAVAADVDTQPPGTAHWAVWVGGERRAEFTTQDAAADYARDLATASGHPAWLNRDGVICRL